MSDGLLTAVPDGQLITAGKPSPLSGVVVSDPNAASSDTVTVILTSKSGLLSAKAAGGATVAGSGTTGLIVTGSLADVNSTLANLTYYDNNPGTHTSDTIDVSTSDSEGRTDDEKLTVGIVQQPAEITTDSTLDFKTSDQSMWSTGQGLNIAQSWTLFSTGIGPVSFSALDGDLTGTASANASLVASLSANSGDISLDYPIDAAISAPNVVAPGQQFTVTTIDNGLDGSDPRFTAEFPQFAAALDAILTANISANFSSDLLGSDSFNYSVDKNIQIASLQTGQTIPIADGLAVTIPNDYQTKAVSVGSGDLPTVTLDATTPDVATANVDLISLITDIANDLGIPIPPLSGSFLDGLASYDVISAILHAGLAITQQFTFDPTSLDVDITAPWGEEAIVPLGQSATFTVPKDWTGAVSLKTSYTLAGNLVSQSGFTGSADLNVKVLSGSVEGLGSFGPLYQNDFPLYNSGPIYVYNPGGSGGFSLDGFNTPTGSINLAVGATSAAAPGAAVIDTTAFTANGAAAIQAAITTNSFGATKSNIYDPATGSGSATFDSTAFNAEIVNAGGSSPYQLPDGFVIGVLEPGAGSAELDGNPYDDLLAAAPAAGQQDTLKSGGNDTLLGGQAGGVTFVIDSNFTGKIVDLEPSDVIDVTDITADSVSYDGSALTIDGTIDDVPFQQDVFSVAGNFAAGHLGYAPDGNGGTDIALYGLATATLASTDIALPNTRIDPNAQIGVAYAALDITNSSAPPAESLSAALVNPTGDGINGAGPLTDLAAGATDDSTLQAGLISKTAGPATGTLTLSSESDGSAITGDGQTTALPDQTITLSGNFYRPASADLVNGTEPTYVVHVGDPGTIPIEIENNAAADGYSEDLVASVDTVDGGGISASGTTGDIAPGDTSDAIALTVPTTTPGQYFDSSVTLDLSSDGTAVDGLSAVSLGSVKIDPEILVLNYAVPVLTNISTSSATLTNSGNDYTLDLGTLSAGAVVNGLTLWLTNTAPHASPPVAGNDYDALGGTITDAGASAYTIQAQPIQDIPAGQGLSQIRISLDTHQAGAFTDTITIDPTSDSPDGTSTALPEMTITVTATITGPAAPTALTLAPASDTGIAGDGVTADTTPTITGDATAGDTVMLDDGTTSVGTATVGSDGTWSIATGALGLGNHTLTATDADGQGFLSAASAPLYLQIGTASGSLTGDGLTSLVITNRNTGSLVVGETAGGPTMGFTEIGRLGPEWHLEGTGAFLGDGNQAELMWDDQSGALTVAEDDGGKAAYTTIANIGPEWQFAGNGPLLGQSTDDFLIWDGSTSSPGYTTLDVGSVAGGTASYTDIGRIGPEWQFKGVGDFLNDGTAGFLIEDSNDGALVVGKDVGGSAQYTAEFGRLGPEWTFEGTGDLLGTGQDDFLIWDTSTSSASYGSLVVGQIVGGSAQYTRIGGVGPEWQFLGVGNYDGQSDSEFLMRNSNSGALVIGTVANAAITYEAVGNIGPEWNLHNTNPATLA